MEIAARIYKTTEDKVMMDIGPFPVTHQGTKVGHITSVDNNLVGLTVTAEITDPHVIELIRNGMTTKCIIENKELKLK